MATPQHTNVKSVDSALKVENFPSKAHHLLEFCSANDPDVACWTEDGDAFIVKDPQSLAMAYLSEYFKHKNFQSFVRQLNSYGFRSIRIKPEASAGITLTGSILFRHEFFRKGNRDLLALVKRVKKSEGKAAGKRKVHASTEESKLPDPNFASASKPIPLPEFSFHSNVPTMDPRDFEIKAMRLEIQQITLKLDTLLNLMTSKSGYVLANPAPVPAAGASAMEDTQHKQKASKRIRPEIHASMEAAQDIASSAAASVDLEKASELSQKSNDSLGAYIDMMMRETIFDEKEHHDIVDITGLDWDEDHRAEATTDKIDDSSGKELEPGDLGSIAAFHPNRTKNEPAPVRVTRVLEVPEAEATTEEVAIRAQPVDAEAEVIEVKPAPIITLSLVGISKRRLYAIMCVLVLLIVTFVSVWVTTPLGNRSSAHSSSSGDYATSTDFVGFTP